MNRQELLNHHAEVCEKAVGIMKQKNHDYAGKDGGQPFANFERCESMGVCSTEQGFLVRVIDKVSRLSTFVSAGELKVDNEGYEDAVLDIINYMILFSAFVKDKNESDSPELPSFNMHTDDTQDLPPQYNSIAHHPV